MQIGTLFIPEPYLLTDYELTRQELFIMESNVRRMQHMIELGYFCGEYSEYEWQKFKKERLEKISVSS